MELASPRQVAGGRRQDDLDTTSPRDAQETNRCTLDNQLGATQSKESVASNWDPRRLGLQIRAVSAPVQGCGTLISHRDARDVLWSRTFAAAATQRRRPVRLPAI